MHFCLRRFHPVLFDGICIMFLTVIGERYRYGFFFVYAIVQAHERADMPIVIDIVVLYPMIDFSVGVEFCLPEADFNMSHFTFNVLPATIKYIFRQVRNYIHKLSTIIRKKILASLKSPVFRSIGLLSLCLDGTLVPNL